MDVVWCPVTLSSLYASSVANACLRFIGPTACHDPITHTLLPAPAMVVFAHASFLVRCRA